MDNTLSCGRLLSNIKQCTIDIYSNIDESPIMDRRRVWGRTDTCKSMVESLYYWTETVTTLPISYYCSVTRSYPTIYSFMNCSMQASLPFTISQSLLKLMSTESVMPSNRLILCGPLLLLPLIFPSIEAFSNVSALCIRWTKDWSSSCSTSPSSKYSGLISLLCTGLSSVLSSTTVQKHLFFTTQFSL